MTLNASRAAFTVRHEPSARRGATVEASVLLAATWALLLSVDVPRRLTMLGQSGMALLTIALACLLCLLTIARVTHQSRSASVLWPLHVFVGWAVARSAFGHTLQQSGIQNLLVLVSFALLVTTAAREASTSEQVGVAVARAASRASTLASIAYLASVLIRGVGTDALFSARSFALAALIGLSSAMSQPRWRHSRSAASVALLLLAIIASLSRSAIVAACVLVCAREVLDLRSRGGRWLRATGFAAVFVLAGFLAAAHVTSFRDRVYGGDNALHIGSAKINTSGREEIWGITEKSIASSPWIGHGAGTAEDVVSAQLPSAGHPHNDYLRIIDDYGWLGLAIWIAWQVRIVVFLRRRMRLAGDTSRRLSTAGIMALAATAFVMLTDNVVVYVFVMAPCAALVGVAVGRALAHDEASPDDPEERRARVHR